MRGGEPRDRIGHGVEPSVVPDADEREDDLLLIAQLQADGVVVQLADDRPARDLERGLARRREVPVAETEVHVQVIRQLVDASAQDLDELMMQRPAIVRRPDETERLLAITTTDEAAAVREVLGSFQMCCRCHLNHFLLD